MAATLGILIILGVSMLFGSLWTMYEERQSKCPEDCECHDHR